MFLDSIFKNNKTVDVEIQPRTQTITNGVLGAVTYTTTKTVKGILWRGSMAESIVGERFKTQVDGVVIEFVRTGSISRRHRPCENRYNTVQRNICG